MKKILTSVGNEPSDIVYFTSGLSFQFSALSSVNIPQNQNLTDCFSSAEVIFITAVRNSARVKLKLHVVNFGYIGLEKKIIGIQRIVAHSGQCNFAVFDEILSF